MSVFVHVISKSIKRTNSVDSEYHQIFNPLVGQAQDTSLLMLDTTYLKAHRTAASLREKRILPSISGNKRRIELQVTCNL